MNTLRSERYEMTPRDPEEANLDMSKTVNTTERTSPVSSMPSWSSQLRILGILLPLAAGLACSFIDQSLLLLSWIPFTLGVASGALLRSWWAVLLAPAALSIGTLSGLAAAGSSPNDIADPGFVAGLTFFVLHALLPAATGAAIGAPLGKQIVRVTVGPLPTPG
jgi:hypothetical protein